MFKRKKDFLQGNYKLCVHKIHPNCFVVNKTADLAHNERKIYNVIHKGASFISTLPNYTTLNDFGGSGYF